MIVQTAAYTSKPLKAWCDVSAELCASRSRGDLIQKVCWCEVNCPIRPRDIQRVQEFAEHIRYSPLEECLFIYGGGLTDKDYYTLVQKLFHANTITVAVTDYSGAQAITPIEESNWRTELKPLLLNTADVETVWIRCPRWGAELAPRLEEFAEQCEAGRFFKDNRHWLLEYKVDPLLVDNWKSAVATLCRRSDVPDWLND